MANNRRGRKAKEFPKISLAHQVIDLNEGEEICLIAPKSADRLMRTLQAVFARSKSLADRSFETESWILVREGKLPKSCVLVRRKI